MWTDNHGCGYTIILGESPSCHRAKLTYSLYSSSACRCRLANVWTLSSTSHFHHCGMFSRPGEVGRNSPFASLLTSKVNQLFIWALAHYVPGHALCSNVPHTQQTNYPYCSQSSRRPRSFVHCHCFQSPSPGFTTRLRVRRVPGSTYMVQVRVHPTRR